MASQVDDHVASEGPLIPSLHEQAEKYCIMCGETDLVALCSRCKGVWYCDEMCQKRDWRCHKILCSKYAKLNENEPPNGGYRAFLFRCDSLQPDIVTLPSSQQVSRPFDSVVDLLRSPDDDAHPPALERLVFGRNNRFAYDPPFLLEGRPRRLGKYQIQITVRANYIVDGSKSNKSLLTSLRGVGTEFPGHYWAGNIVVRRIKSSTSVTMADFRHTLDWFAEFSAQREGTPAFFLELPWKFDGVKGVVIAGDDYIKNESDRYTAVTVSGSHSIRGLMKELCGHISPISMRVGRPLRLVMRVRRYRFGENSPADRLTTCGPAMALIQSLDNGTNALPLDAVTLPDEDLPTADHVLIVRADDKDLSVDDVRAMVHFSGSMCREVLRGIALTPQEDKSGKEAAMQKASDYITRDNYLLAFDELGIPRPEWPAEEAFVDVRSLSIPDLEDEDWEDDEDDESSEDDDESDDESDASFEIPLVV